MADRAQIKLTLDARQARGEAQRARKRLEANEKRVADQLRAARRRRGADGQVARGLALGAAARGGLAGVAGAVIGAAGARAAGALAPVAGALAAFEGAAEVAALTAEIFSETLLRPIVQTLLRETLPVILPDFIAVPLTAAIELQVQEKLRDAIDDFRRVARFEAITKQLARQQIFGVAATFERAGEGFTLSQAVNLSENFVRQSERSSFLKRAETRRTTEAVARGLVERITNGMGE